MISKEELWENIDINLKRLYQAGTSLTIDHIKPVSKFPDMAMDIDNLQVLCWECNTEKSNKHYTDYRDNEN